MEFRHIIAFSVLIVLIVAASLQANIFTLALLQKIVAAPLILVVLLFGVSKLNGLGLPGFTSGFSGSSRGNGFYDTDIEPDEAWAFVNNRIDELEEEGKYTPYRKIKTDSTDKRKARKSNQNTVPAKIDGRRTRVTWIVGRPKSQDEYKEMIAFAVDLKGPSIDDYNGDVRDEERRKNPFPGKYNYIERGGDSDVPEREDDGTTININNNQDEKGGA
jgi:hypothetical protein